MDITAINKARIVYYGLFSSLFSFNMNEGSFDKTIQAVEILSQNSIDEQSEKAFANMERRLRNGGYKALKKENNRIFYSPSFLPVPVTASYYTEGRDDGPKRVEMIGYVLESTFRKNAGSYKEHEDHIEFVMLFLQKLIAQEIEGNVAARKLSVKVFEGILNPMIDEFSTRLLDHEHSYFYKQVALALRSFIEFERVYLNISTPEKGLGVAERQPDAAEKRTRSGGCIKIGAHLPL